VVPGYETCLGVFSGFFLPLAFDLSLDFVFDLASTIVFAFARLIFDFAAPLNALKMLKRKIPRFTGVGPIRSTNYGHIEGVGPTGTASGWKQSRQWETARPEKAQIGLRPDLAIRT
jgi:hypothetical protein